MKGILVSFLQNYIFITLNPKKFIITITLMTLKTDISGIFLLNHSILGSESFLRINESELEMIVINLKL